MALPECDNLHIVSNKMTCATACLQAVLGALKPFYIELH